jgi:predicted nucleic-acid-binding protein
MREIIVDTNFLISFVTDRNPAQQEKAAELFLSAARLKTLLLCPSSVIIEFVYVLEKIYRHPREQIREAVADLLALPGLEVMQLVDFNLVLTFWPGQIADFGDALVAAAAKARKEAQVATFDKRLISALNRVRIKSAPL